MTKTGALFGLKYPLLQAPIGSIASVELAAAVCNAGGLGSLALAWSEPELAKQRIQHLQAQTSKPFFVNFVLAFAAKALNTALDCGTPIVTFSWGQPGTLIKHVHSFNALAGVQVGCTDGAKQALDDGADFIICQGVEAGGHVQSTTPLAQLLLEVVELAEDIPVIAAGGIADAIAINTALQHGAAAVMLGTRFIATVESNAHRLYKQALVDAAASDSVYTLCFDGGWPYAPHRVLRNSVLQQWEAAGCPPTGQRPGENDVLASNANGSLIKRYDDAPPQQQTSGQILDCCLYAGTGCGVIENIPSAAQLIAQLFDQNTARSVNHQ